MRKECRPTDVCMQIAAMEHSTAILEDASNAIEAAARHASTAEVNSSTPRTEAADEDSNQNWRKRKADSSLRYGSKRGGREGRGGRGGRGGRDDRRGNKKRDMGRAEYL